jgi:small GTP-binding protein
MSEIKEFQKKVALIGDAAVGKTSIIKRYVVDLFDDQYISTIGTKITAKELNITLNEKKYYLKLQIWDILGQKGFTKLYDSSFKGTNGVFFVADVTRRKTLYSLKNYWIPMVWKTIGRIPIVILANKCDLNENAEFDYNELKKFTAKYKAPFYFTSAKNGENVNNAFVKLGILMMQFRRPGTQEPQEMSIDVIKDKNAELIDKIIDDFCGEYGGIEEAMPVLRRQFELAKLDLNNPTKMALFSAVEGLAKIEMGFMGRDVVEANLRKRRRWIRNT